MIKLVSNIENKEGKDCILLWEPMNNLAVFETKQQFLQKSEDIYIKLLSILDKNYGKRSIYSLEILNNLSCLYAY